MLTPDLKRLLELQKKMPKRPWLFVRDRIDVAEESTPCYRASLNGANIWTDNEDVARFLELAANLVDCLEPMPRTMKVQEVKNGEKRNEEKRP